MFYLISIASAAIPGIGGSLVGKLLQIFVLFTVLSLAPAIVIMVTSFTRIAVVLAMLRQALGLQQTPPNMVLVSLALFLTAFIMQPTLTEIYHNGVRPLIEEKIGEEEAFEKIIEPAKKFMLAQVGSKELEAFFQLSEITIKDPSDTPLHVLIPAFMISELKKAFQIGFLLFLPFMIIDLVVAIILMAMGMMMLPPVMISLPFKIIFFVLVDGWILVCTNLSQSFG